jgi:hypothetical protein
MLSQGAASSLSVIALFGGWSVGPGSAVPSLGSSFISHHEDVIDQ